MSPEELEDFVDLLDDYGEYECYWRTELEDFSDPEFQRRLALLHAAYDCVEQYVQSQAKEKNISLDY